MNWHERALTTAVTAASLALGGCYHAGLLACRVERERLFVHVKKYEGERAARELATRPPGAPPPAVDWKEHRAFLVVRDGRLVRPERQHVATLGVYRERHLVTLYLHGLRLGNVPNVSPNDWVAVGAVLGGGPRDRPPLRRVLGVAMARGPNATVRLREVPLAAAVTWPAQRLTLTLVAQPVSHDEATWLQAALTRTAPRVGPLSAAAPAAVRAAADLYAATFERYRARGPWRVALRWYAGDSVHNEQPERVLLEGLQVLVARPPPGAPSPLFPTRPTRAALRGCSVADGRLVRGTTGAPCVETPYVVLRVHREPRPLRAR